MQQLQSNYRGDSSPSLAQIFGMQYQPQGATSQMANTALASGMSAGAQIKATAMNNDTQMAISNAARMENRRQFNLTHALAGRTANETQRHNMALEGISKQTTDWQTGGSIAADDQKALGAIQGQITEMEMVLNMLDKSDPQYAAKAAMIQGRIKSLRDGASRAAGARGGATGFATQTGRMFDANGASFTGQAGNLLDAVAAANRPKATPQAKPLDTIKVPTLNSGGTYNVGNVGALTGTPNSPYTITIPQTLTNIMGPAGGRSWTANWNTSGVSGLPTAPPATSPATSSAAVDPVVDVLGPVTGGTPASTPMSPATPVDPVLDVLGYPTTP